MKNQHLLSVIILTHNEEIHIERAIRSVAPLTAQIFVVDSFSTDRTLEIARSTGAIAITHEFINYAKQFQWALDTLPIASSWVMRLDADEVVTPELVVEIQSRLPELAQDVTGVVLRLGYVFWGHKINYGGRWLKLLRITRIGSARIEQRWMDEHMVLLHGRTVIFRNNMFDWNLNDLTFFTEKHNKYSAREAVDVLIKRYNLLEYELINAKTSSQAATKRWLKDKIYNRLPFFVGPFCYFLFRYFILLGFLDGLAGLIYHFLQGFWYRFLVEAKVLEFDRVLRDLPDAEMRLVELERLSGYRLAE